MNVATLWTSLAAVAVCGSVTTAAVAAPGPSAPEHSTDQQAAGGQDVESAARRPPNVVLITADDMMASDLAAMPNTRRLLARRGTIFSQGIAPTPLCVPSRVSMLTGRYAHNHNARAIRGPRGGFNAFSGSRDANTLPVWLRRGGYSTMHVGRYLNGYGNTSRSAHYVPDGWNAWRTTVDGTFSYTGTRFTFNGGKINKPHGYSTDIIARYTRDMLDRQHRVASRKPFFLWANYVAPHSGGGHETDDPPGACTWRPPDRPIGTATGSSTRTCPGSRRCGSAPDQDGPGHDRRHASEQRSARHTSSDWNRCWRWTRR